MSYNLRIGNGVKISEDQIRKEYELDEEDEISEFMQWKVADVYLHEAPSFPDDQLSSHVNTRYPSYSGWESFTKALRIDATMQELMPRHPGVVRIKSEHLNAVIKARKYFQKLHPNIEPGFKDNDASSGHLARILWLEWWMNWALENCDNPMFYNS